MRIKSWTHSNCCLHFYIIAYLHLKVNAFCDSEGEGQRQDKLHEVESIRKKIHVAQITVALHIHLHMKVKDIRVYI